MVIWCQQSGNTFSDCYCRCFDHSRNVLCFRSIKPLMGNALGKAMLNLWSKSRKTKIPCYYLLFSVISKYYGILGPVLFIGIVVPHFAECYGILHSYGSNGFSIYYLVPVC